MMQESLASKYGVSDIRKSSFRTMKEFHHRSVYLDCSYTYFFKPQLSSTQKGRDTSAISNDRYIVTTKKSSGCVFLYISCLSLHG